MNLPSPELRLILAAQSAQLSASLGQSGFIPMEQDKAISTLECAGLWFGPRRILEENEAYRQIIPYIILETGSHLVQYTRKPAGAEVRLHGRTSIGLGGHVDITDAVSQDERLDLLATLERAAKRELIEELGVVAFEQQRWVGLLVDNDSSVGRVHVGLVGIWTIDAALDGVTEAAIGDVTVQSIEEVEIEFDRLETWSAMLIPWLRHEL